MQVILTPHECKVWEQAYERWGDHHQHTMAMEECAETIKAVAHYERSRAMIGTVIDEFADAFVCVGQVIHSETGLAQINTAEVIEKAISLAFKKLQAKLEADNKNHGAER